MVGLRSKRQVSGLLLTAVGYAGALQNVVLSSALRHLKRKYIAVATIGWTLAYLQEPDGDGLFAFDYFHFVGSFLFAGEGAVLQFVESERSVDQSLVEPDLVPELVLDVIYSDLQVLNQQSLALRNHFLPALFPHFCRYNYFLVLPVDVLKGGLQQGAVVDFEQSVAGAGRQSEVEGKSRGREGG